VGLLPTITSLRERGFKVKTGQRDEVLFIEFPTEPPIRLEMKSAEQTNLSVAASAVDVVWLDEDPGETKYNEAVARIFRKSGRIFFSFLITYPANPKTHYISTKGGLFDVWEQAKKDGDEWAEKVDYYFMTDKDNKSLSEEDIEFYEKQTTKKERFQRYSKTGRWVTQIEGEKTVPAFNDTIHVATDLVNDYIPDKTLWFGWDLGYLKPAFVAAQLDGRVIKILYADLGMDSIIQEFLDISLKRVREIMPRLESTFHILPHDARKRNDQTGKSTEQIFQDAPFNLSCKSIYTYKDASREQINNRFNLFAGGKPTILIDSTYAEPLISALNLSVVNEKTRQMEKDGYNEHLIDALIKLIVHLDMHPDYLRLTNSHHDYTEREDIPQIGVRIQG